MTRRRPDGATYLFDDYKLQAVCDAHREKMKRAISDAAADTIRSGDVDALTAGFVSEFALEPPELIEGATSVDVEEAQVDVSRDPLRFITDASKPFYIPGIRATYFVPFIGDHQLFK